LTFGTEVVISVEIRSLSYQVEHYNPGLNSEGMKLHLDLLQERRDKAQVMMRRSKQYFNKKVRHQNFGIGDWVLRKVTLATRNPNDRKLGPKWEGPYQVIRFHRQGTYYLRAADERPLPRPRNLEHLKRCYQ
jgi:hypothetical protein